MLRLPAFLSLTCAVLVACVAGHASLTIPVPRNNHAAMKPMHNSTPGGYNAHEDGPCAGGACYWFSVGCFTGCSNCSGVVGASAGRYDKPNCERPLEPTLPSKFRTWNIENKSAVGDFTKYRPWRNPGRAPVADPCGLAGAYKHGGSQIPAGAKAGDLGSQLPPLVGVHTEWPAGGIAEVGWMIAANHGGGYLYSICPKNHNLTEACFQGRSLTFVGVEHTIRWLDGSRPDIQIPSTEVDEGTFPAGSAWRMNPIPACNCDDGRGCKVDGPGEERAYSLNPDPNCSIPKPVGPEPATGGCYTGTQFPAPFHMGCGQQLWDVEKGPTKDSWVIIDKVRVPEEAGDYVLRWRWDTEQNSQVWTNCADVTVVQQIVV